MTDANRRRELQWLNDILEAVEKIQGHPKFREGQQAFNEDEHFRVWVFYFIERIGECASNLRRDFDYDNKHPEVAWQDAQAMRRYLAHRYWATDLGKVWQGVEYLDTIKSTVKDILNSETPTTD